MKGLIYLTSNVICIWQPKYSTKEVLVATQKVREGKNYLFFVADRNWQDLYSFDGTKVKQECKISSNGKILVYDIPLSYLNNEGPLPEKLIAFKQIEYDKFKIKSKKQK